MLAIKFGALKLRQINFNLSEFFRILQILINYRIKTIVICKLHFMVMQA